MRFGYLPMSDLYAFCGRREVTTIARGGGTRTVTLEPVGAILDLFGLERRTTIGERWAQRLVRAQRTGWLRIEWAEDLCDIHHIHPTAVWGNAYYDHQHEPQEEPNNQFCGRHEQWQAIGHTRHYGIYGTI
jgi:hypothetical protein